jgi:hypothetical protein
MTNINRLPIELPDGYEYMYESFNETNGEETGIGLSKCYQLRENTPSPGHS